MYLEGSYGNNEQHMYTTATIIIEIPYKALPDISIPTTAATSMDILQVGLSPLCF